MSSIISISELELHLDDKKILDNINLKIAQGENLVLMGKSGSGKSVLTKAIIGFLKYNKGSLTIEGKKIIYPVEENIKLHKIGVVFQHNALFDSLPVWQNISFGLLQRGITRKNAWEKAREKLKLVGLDEETANKFPNELSGGMQKRIAILRTAILEPEIIILDEPTTGLDPITSNLIIDFILSIAGNITKITITHDINVARRIASHVAMLEDGKLKWYGKISEMENCNDEYVKKFLSYS